MREMQRADSPEMGEDSPEKEDSISLYDNPEYIFQDSNIESAKVAETHSNRQKLLVDDEDVFRHLAPTMRNPNINKLNVLDTLADVRAFNTKR